MKEIITERNCKDCKKNIPYAPRIIRCIGCYIKYLEGPVQFIKDDE
jgi:hypothetical protein